MKQLGRSPEMSVLLIRLVTSTNKRGGREERGEGGRVRGEIVKEGEERGERERK